MRCPICKTNIRGKKIGNDSEKRTFFNREGLPISREEVARKHVYKCLACEEKGRPCCYMWIKSNARPHMQIWRFEGGKWNNLSVKLPSAYVMY